MTAGLQLNRCLFLAQTGELDEFVVASAVANYRMPEQCRNPEVVDAESYYYTAESTDGSQWQCGVAPYYVSTQTLARSEGEIFDSSNDGGPVSFSSAPLVALGALAQGFPSGAFDRLTGKVGFGVASVTDLTDATLTVKPPAYLLGPELVTNGSFATSTDWLTQFAILPPVGPVQDLPLDAWSYGTDEATHTENSAGLVLLLSSDDIPSGVNYQVGDILTLLDGNGDATAQVEEIDGSGAPTVFSVVSPGTGYDALSGSGLSEVTGGSGTDFVWIAYGTGISPLMQDGAPTIGRIYKVELTISGSIGTVIVQVGGTLQDSAPTYSAGDGAVTFTSVPVTATPTYLIRIIPTQDFNGTITNVSVTEVIPPTVEIWKHTNGREAARWIVASTGVLNNPVIFSLDSSGAVRLRPGGVEDAYIGFENMDGYVAQINPDALSANRKITLQNVAGTIAYLSDIPAPSAVLELPSFAAADLVAASPDASGWTGGMVYVPDESGGAVPAFSDGTNWRRVTDRAIVS